MDIQDVLWRYGLRFDLDRKDEWFELFAEDCQFSSDVPGFLLELNGFDEIEHHITTLLDRANMNVLCGLQKTNLNAMI